MIDLLVILAIVGACWLSFALGAYLGRAAERRAIASGKVEPRGVRPIVNWETELRKARGASLKHPSPETATRQRRLRIKR